MQQGDSIGALRQLPLKQFRAELYKNDRQDSRTHASEAGCKLAEVLVRQKLDLSDVDRIKLERYRRLYHVPKWQMSTFISSCKAAIPFETSWQYHPE